MPLDLGLCFIERTMLRCTKHPKNTQNKAVVPPLWAASAELCLDTILSFPFYSKPVFWNQSGFCCIHPTAVRGTHIKEDAQQECWGLQEGSAGAENPPKITSAWPGSLVWKGWSPFEPRWAISGRPKHPDETQLKEMKANRALLPVSPLHLCPSHSIVLFLLCFVPRNSLWA